MKLMTDDVTGLFLIPFGASLNLDSWDMMNALGLAFVPFIVLYIKSAFEARSQGADEGSWGVLALKNIEKGFVGYVFVIAIFLTPIDSTLTVKHAQYSCLDNPSLATSGDKDISKASDSILKALNIRGDSLAQGVGLLHSVSLGINNAMIAGMSCSRGAMKGDVTEILASMIPKTETVYESIKAFDHGCYSVAKGNARAALARNEQFLVDPQKLEGWAFHPAPWAEPLMTAVYDNNYIKGKVTGRGKLYLEAPNTWFNSAQRGKTLKCSTLAKDLYNKIESDMMKYEDFNENEKKILNYTKLFNAKAGQALIRHDLVNAIYASATSGGGASKTRWLDAESNSFFSSWFGSSTAEKEAWDEGIAKFNNKLEGDFNLMSSASNVMVGVGSLFADITESAKGHAVTMILPIMIVMSKAVLITALPLLTVISGYSFKFIYHWCLLYFAISLVPFWLSVGMHLETMLLSMSDYQASIIQQAGDIVSGNGVDVFLISSTAATFKYLIPVIWIMLVQMIGNISGSSFMNMVAGAAVAGQSGASVAIERAGKTADSAYKGLKEHYANGKTPDIPSSTGSAAKIEQSN